MLFYSTLTKKLIEKLILDTFLIFGSLSTAQLLDSLKFLGFTSATNAGISLTLEDLKIPTSKIQLLDKSNYIHHETNQNWKEAFLSESERFLKNISLWSTLSETLKQNIINFYQIFEPVNNLYLMAFSGARGSLTQVQQVIGLRGLMADQDGKLINIPIKTNFREGLSIIDYIISSYGARKGVVDTALKTADSGYLTRRLIYVTQELIIKNINCNTSKGLLYLLTKNSNLKNILGHYCVKIFLMFSPYTPLLSQLLLLTPSILTYLENYYPLFVVIRSSITCEFFPNICQICYGTDISKRTLIQLGEAVGILSAQAIGEPGTQLTMRTFHTGGIYSGNSLNEKILPFTGKIFTTNYFKSNISRTVIGKKYYTLQNDLFLNLTNWKGIQQTLFLQQGTYFYKQTSFFGLKNNLLAEISSKNSTFQNLSAKKMFTVTAALTIFDELSVYKDPIKNCKIVVKPGYLWLEQGHIFPLLKVFKYSFSHTLTSEISFGYYKICTPVEGLFILTPNFFSIEIQDHKIEFSYHSFFPSSSAYNYKFIPFLKTFQYIEKHTVLGYLYIFPKQDLEICNCKVKIYNQYCTYFLITKNQCTSICPETNNIYQKYIRHKWIKKITNQLKLAFINTFIKHIGYKNFVHNTIILYLPTYTQLHIKNNNFISANNILLTYFNSIQHTEDIVQGLPKIEEIIENLVPTNTALLASKPSLFLEQDYSSYKIRVKNNTRVDLLFKKEDLTTQFSLLNSIASNQILIACFEQLYRPSNFSSCFNFIYNNHNDYILKLMNIFIEESLHTLLGLFTFTKWNKYKKFIQVSKVLLPKCKIIKKNIYTNYYIFYTLNTTYLIQLSLFNYLVLEKYSLATVKTCKTDQKLLLHSGMYTNMLQTYTEGLIDLNQLLKMLYHYHKIYNGLLIGTLKSIIKFRIILVNSLQAIYASQGINISTKHFEILLLQMTSKILITYVEEIPLDQGELISFYLVSEMLKLLLQKKYNKYSYFTYIPYYCSITQSSLKKEGFLINASYQQTRTILLHAAIDQSTDWFYSLKDSILGNRIVPSGTSFLNTSHYLNTIYYFKG